MPTLVLSPRYSSDSRVLREAAMQAGWQVFRLGGWRVPDSLQGRDIVLSGEPLFVEVIAARLSLAMIDAPFDWLLKLPDHYRRRRITLSTMGEARSIAQPTFVKPADGRKSFEGKVYASGAELPPIEAVSDATQVMVAEPVTWEVEFRCFVLERNVTTLSPYWRQGALAQTDEGTWEASPEEQREVRDFMERLLADQEVPLPPAIVLDVGKISGRGWAVIEANAAWGAGLYGCDPARVLPVLARACIKRDLLTPEDAAWAMPAAELIDG